MSSTTSDLISKIEKLKDSRVALNHKPGAPRIKFHLDRSFNYTGNIIAREFLIDLNELSGTYIWPIHIEDACIFISTCCEDTKDFRGKDFRHLFLKDPEYHSVFEQYDISAIYFYGFDNTGNYDTRFLIGRGGIPYNK